MVRSADTRLTADVKAGQHLWEPLLLSPILSAPEIVVPSMSNAIAANYNIKDAIANLLSSWPNCIFITNQ